MRKPEGVPKSWPSRALTSTDLARARVPERYWMASLGLLPMTAPYRAPIGRYLSRFDQAVQDGTGLYLWGTEPGTGKTALASALLIKTLAWKFSGLFLRTPEVKDAAATSQAFSDEETLLQRAHKVDVLVLDDLGQEYSGASGFVERVIEDLVRARVQAGRVTFLTSNIPPRDLGAKYAPTTVDLLREACVSLEIVGQAGGGKSWRREKVQSMKALVLGGPDE